MLPSALVFTGMKLSLLEPASNGSHVVAQHEPRSKHASPSEISAVLPCTVIWFVEQRLLTGSFFRVSPLAFSLNFCNGDPSSAPRIAVASCQCDTCPC